MESALETPDCANTENAHSNITETATMEGPTLLARNVIINLHRLFALE